MKDLQAKVRAFVAKHNLVHANEISVLDLVSEVGEVAKEILKGINYGKKPFKKTEETKEEIGDLFYSLITLANTLEIDLEEALNLVLNKYEERMKNSKSAGSGR